MKNQLLNLKMIALVCLMMVLGGAKVWAQETVTIWSEDWTGQKAGATPSSINSMYSQGKADTKLYTGAMSAGGVAPELLLASKDKWTIKISDLKGCSGEFTLSFHTNKIPTNNNPISVSANGNILKLSVSNKKLCTGKFNVEEGRSNVTIIFNNSTTKNARIDDIVLTGAKAQTKKLTSLAISSQPTKTTYNVGEEFDPTGLVVTGTYDDNTTAPITGGITWTKNPETMSLGNTSCTVTASVGEVKSEPFVVNGLNVVKAIVFDFTKDWEGFTAIAPSNNGNQTNGEQVVAGKELKVDGVVMTATNGEDSYNKTYYTGLYKNNDGQNLRVYVKGSLTFTAPEGYNLSEVKFAGSKLYNFTTADEAYKNPTWTGNAHAVTFTASSSVQVETVTIKLVEVAGPTYTKQTPVTFRAEDNGDYYATFSNDKVTFITSDNSEAYKIVVSGGNIVKTKFDEVSADIKGETVKGFYIPANTGVLLYSVAKTADYYTVENKTVDAISPADNMLMPAPKDGGVFAFNEDYKYYKLAYGDFDNHKGLGFYWGAENGGAFYVKAGTAYLAVPAGENAAKGFTLNGEATGIEGVNANVENAKAIYNLNGQRVASMAKPGLYIVNGKKVVRK